MDPIEPFAVKNPQPELQQPPPSPHPQNRATRSLFITPTNPPSPGISPTTPISTVCALLPHLKPTNPSEPCRGQSSATGRRRSGGVDEAWSVGSRRTGLAAIWGIEAGRYWNNSFPISPGARKMAMRGRALLGTALFEALLASSLKRQHSKIQVKDDCLFLANFTGLDQL
jgi:hypothetical protein